MCAHVRSPQKRPELRHSAAHINATFPGPPVRRTCAHLYKNVRCAQVPLWGFGCINSAPFWYPDPGLASPLAAVETDKTLVLALRQCAVERHPNLGGALLLVLLGVGVLGVEAGPHCGLPNGSHWEHAWLGLKVLPIGRKRRPQRRVEQPQPPRPPG